MEREDEPAVPSFTSLCEEHAVPQEKVVGLRALLQRMADSGRESVSLIAGSERGARLQQSLRHKQIEMLSAVPNLPRKTFIDEVLEEVAIVGPKAWATRRTANGHSEEVGFVRRKGEWFIRIFAKRPGRGSG
jgi:hypothetical protein